MLTQETPCCIFANFVVKLQDDDSRQQLLLQVLTKSEQMECFMQERKHSLCVKVQQAAMWLPKVSQPHQVSEGQQQQQQQSRPLQRNISGSDNAETGYVNICGIALPCNILNASSVLAAPAGHTLIHTGAVDDNLKAAALALCQTRPLLLEGPPGQLQHHLLMCCSVLSLAMRC